MNCQGESKTRSGDLDLDRGERGGEVEVKVGAVSPPVEDGDFESPPTTPRSTTSCSPFLECPSTPLLK